MDPHTQTIINLLSQARTIPGPRSVLPQDYPNQVVKLDRIIAQLSRQAMRTSAVVQEHKPSYDRYQYLMNTTAQWLREDDKKINDMLLKINSHFYKLKREIPL